MLAALKELQEQQQESLSMIDQERHILQPKLKEELEVILRGEMFQRYRNCRSNN